MKAYFLVKGTTGPRDLKFETRPDPKPGAREILVRMRAASLNYRDQVIARDAYMGTKMDTDTVPLSDGAGEVIEIGAGVTRFKSGDRVAGTFNRGWIAGSHKDGAYQQLGQVGVPGVLAELVVFDEQDAVHIPEALSFAEAACLPCAALTAWSALVVAGGMKAGHSVLTLGTGGVSVFAIQLAKAAGCFVISTSSSDEKLSKAKALGADGLINYKTTPEWDVRVRELTGGRGVDHVVEIGGAGTLERSYRSTANNGCVAMIGFLAAAEKYPMIALPRWGKLVRVNVGSREGFEAMNRAIAANHIKPVIDKVFPFERAIEAYEYEATGQHFGKVVIKI
jgi:NADPH:quinone reductase-like Zn-dependent oxidoreductase